MSHEEAHSLLPAKASKVLAVSRDLPRAPNLDEAQGGDKSTKQKADRVLNYLNETN